MTDKEKARELAIAYFAETDEQGHLVYDTRCEAACQEMAQWQKEQIINKTCKWIVALNDEHHIMSYADHHILNTDELIKGFNNFMETEK